MAAHPGVAVIAGILLGLHAAAKAIGPPLGSAFRALRPFAPWIAAGVCGALAVWFMPVVGFGAQIVRAELKADTWEKSAGDWRKASRGWESSFRKSEDNRKVEQDRAVDSVDLERKACTARVAEARRSARVIETIITKEPTYDANLCPVRELVDPGQLRQALDP